MPFREREMVFFVAQEQSTRGGYHKKTFASCPHRHRTFGAASACADKQTPSRSGRWWIVSEFVAIREYQSIREY